MFFLAPFGGKMAEGQIGGAASREIIRFFRPSSSPPSPAIRRSAPPFPHRGQGKEGAVSRRRYASFARTHTAGETQCAPFRLAGLLYSYKSLLFYHRSNKNKGGEKIRVCIVYRIINSVTNFHSVARSLSGASRQDGRRARGPRSYGLLYEWGAL